MQLVIADHSLNDSNGHHYEYDCAIAAAAAERGCTVTVLANRGFSDTTEGMTVLPWFRQTFYEIADGQSLRRLIYPVLSALPPGLGRAAHLALRRIWDQRRRSPLRGAVSNGFGADLLQGIDRLDLTAGDHVLVHTLNLDDLEALTGDLVDRGEPHRLPTIHLVLRRTVDEMSRGRSRGRLPADALGRLAEARRAIRLWSDTAELAADYAALSPLPVGVLPVAFRQDLMAAALAARPARSPDSPITLGYLGNARPEKGFQHLPALAEGLLAHPIHGGYVRFVVQCGLNIEGGEPGIVAARDRLAGLPAGRIHLVDGVPDAAAYYALLAEMDIVLLPYEAASYRTRSSGILVQALAAGRPVVVPADTWMAGQIDASSGRSFTDPRALLPVVVTLLDAFPDLAGATEKAAPEWCRRHAPGRFVDLLLDTRG
jgi:glycosyltransferase involved in cell wall biosynthesis